MPSRRAASVTGEANTNSFRYTGREDDGTGLYFYRSRYYSPRLQRFISEDPIGLGGGVNLYAYAANNPIAFGDPFGLKPKRGMGSGNPGSPGVPGGGDGSGPDGGSGDGDGDGDSGKPCGTTGLGGGIIFSWSGNLDLGLGDVGGITGTFSRGIGVFYDNATGQASLGVTEQMGGAYRLPFDQQDERPVQDVVNPFSLGGFIGIGTSITFTNARSPYQTAGHAKTESLNGGFLGKGGLQVTTSGNIWQKGGSLGLGGGGSYSRMTTDTKVLEGNGCGGG